MRISNYKIATLLILFYVMVPISNVMQLQLLNLIVAAMFVFLFPRVDAFLLWVLLMVSILILSTSIATLNTSIEIFKPIISLFTLFCFSGYLSDRKAYLHVNRRLLIWSIAGFSLVVHYSGFTFFEYLYRGDAADSYHSGRLTAPFLFAGDLANAFLLMAFASYATGSPSFLSLLGIVLTQSKLGYLAVITTARRVMTPSLAIFAILTLTFGFIYFELQKYIYHIIAFLENFSDYLVDSKRAREYIWVFDNFESIFFKGADNFSVDGITSHAESSILSYMVKVGVLATILYWVGVSWYFIKRQMSFFLLVTILFALFAAPLDRPKLSVFILFMAPLVSKRETA